MFFLNRKINGSDGLIICFSLLLFLIRLYLCKHIAPNFFGLDYDGYIELGKNIFNKLDFTVRWEVGSPVGYPPLFSILVHLLTYLTKNSIISIQYINIFSASFYLIPLFYLVRNILNIYSAILAVVFTTYYFGVDPCVELKSDFFFSFLIIIICWLIWSILINRSRQAGQYVFAGFLISIAYLTKFSGIFFCCASVASIIYYFARCRQSIKTGFKMSAFLLLGVLPLFIAYHLLLYNNINKEAYSICAYTFFDGNYKYQGGNDYKRMKKYGLNLEGTEFNNEVFLKSHHVLNFILEKPLFVFDKYIWGSKLMINNISSRVFPLMPGNASVVFQYTFLFLLIISGIYFRWHFRMMHIFFFVIGLMFVPLFYPDQRYAMPFMPLYFVLWLFILNIGVHFMDALIKNKVYSRSVAIVFFISFNLVYLNKGYVQARQEYVYFANLAKDNSWLKAASWIKNDAASLPQRAKIMSEYNYLSCLTDSDFIKLPIRSKNWDKIIDFAVLKNVNYIVISQGSLISFMTFLEDVSIESKHIKTVHPINVNNRMFFIIKI